MKKLLVGVLSTSEFWAVVGEATAEAVNAPVPVEAKVAGWAYVALRITGKVARYLIPKLFGAKKPTSTP